MVYVLRPPLGLAFLAIAAVAIRPSTVAAQDTRDAEAAVALRSGPIGDGVVDLPATVERPASRRCVVTLFARRQFLGDAPLPLAYRPPADCPGPWAKVVLEADLDVTAGLQFDRTAALTIGNATLFVGTTMEPGRGYAPKWHVERDVTDYAALLARPAAGVAALTNFTDVEHDGRTFWSARLVFYAAGAHARARPSLVVPVTRGLQRIDAAKPAYARTLRLPRNLTRLHVDLFAIGQEREEFWYDCRPRIRGRQMMPWFTPCHAPYREVEVRIDGALAGIHALAPVIFTGGLAPALWRRAPGLHATDLPPTRVDLTPFVARLNDGRPHRIALAIPGVGTYFRIGAALLAETDPGRAVVTGAVTHNTLAPARVTTAEVPSDAKATRTTRTTATRSDRVVGYALTSRGRIDTSIDYTLASTLTGIAMPRQSIKRLDLSQSATIVTMSASGRASTERFDERDRLTVDIHVAPPRYGVTFGTEITQLVDRTQHRDGNVRRVTDTLTTFAPTASPFAEPRETPNRVTRTRRVAIGKACRLTSIDVADDAITRVDTSPCDRGAARPLTEKPDLNGPPV